MNTWFRNAPLVPTFWPTWFRNAPLCDITAGDLASLQCDEAITTSGTATALGISSLAATGAMEFGTYSLYFCTAWFRNAPVITTTDKTWFQGAPVIDPCAAEAPLVIGICRIVFGGQGELSQYRALDATGTITFGGQASASFAETISATGTIIFGDYADLTNKGGPVSRLMFHICSASQPRLPYMRAAPVPAYMRTVSAGHERVRKLKVP